MNESEQENEVEGLLYSCQSDGCGHVLFLTSEDEDLPAIGDAIRLRRPCPICGGTMILLPTP